MTDDSTDADTADEVTESSADKVTKDSTDKVIEGSTDKLTGKFTEKMTEEPTEKQTENSTDEVTESSTDKVTDPTTDKTTEEPTEKQTEDSTDEVTDDSTEEEDYDEYDDPEAEAELEAGFRTASQEKHDRISEELDKRMGSLLPTGDKEHRKTYSEVFNESTMNSIYRLFQRKVLDTVEFPLSTGKEANVFLGTDKKRESVAVKIFRESTTTFRKVRPYIEGDPRFRHVLKDRRGLVELWARKEFKNLKRLEAAGVNVPSAIAIERNVLVMEYIGDENRAAPTLRQWYIEHRDDPDTAEKMSIFYETISVAMQRIHQKAKMVHADLSEFNILVHEEEPVIIDVGQGVLLAHPMAREFFDRDIKNITAFFRRAGVDADEAALKERVLNEPVDD